MMLLNIDYQFEQTTDLKISIFNSLGQVVQQQVFSAVLRGGTLLSLQELEKGVYFAEFTDSFGGRSVKKLVKE